MSFDKSSFVAVDLVVLPQTSDESGHPQFLRLALNLDFWTISATRFSSTELQFLVSI